MSGRGAGAGAAPTQTPQARANQLLGQGVLALATRDFAAAYRALSEAYRLVPVPDTLFQLGVVAWGEGRSVPAQDMLRRYLADPGAATSGDKRAEAERIVKPALVAEDFAGAMEAFAGLRAPVDALFDKVTVNVTDKPELRLNRLKLLNQIRATMDTVADFSKIEG